AFLAPCRLIVKHTGLLPLPASPSRPSVRRQKELPPSRHGDGPYCYLKNPGFEPCPVRRDFLSLLARSLRLHWPLATLFSPHATHSPLAIILSPLATCRRPRIEAMRGR